MRIREFAPKKEELCIVAELQANLAGAGAEAFEVVILENFESLE